MTLLPRFVADAELAALLRRADVVALPYRSIDNSGVVFAALAVGAGLVLTDVGGFRELHDRDGVGMLVPPGDPDALAGALIDVLTSPERRDQLRAASRSCAEGGSAGPRSPPPPNPSTVSCNDPATLHRRL